MIILDFLFRNRPWLIKKSFRDDSFGLMWFNKDRNPEFSHYQGHTLFKPTNSKIDIFIDSDIDGFEQQQKSFFNEIESRYFEIIDKSSKQVEDYLNKKQNKSTKSMDFKNDFRLHAISISRKPTEKWSLHYDCDMQAITGITIQFKNWDILNVFE